MELDLPEPDEIGTTFIDNADLKARAAADLSGLPALADDSGLCVEALGDRPGIFSARWAVRDAHVDPMAGPGEVSGERDFSFAMARVLTELEALGPEVSRNAHFVCATVALSDGSCLVIHHIKIFRQLIANFHRRPAEVFLFR